MPYLFLYGAMYDEDGNGECFFSNLHERKKVHSLITIPVGPLEVNCYILWDKDTKDAFVIDPGGDSDDIIAAIEKEQLKVRYIVHTHGHFDHVGANAALKKRLFAPIAIHENDAVLMTDAHEHAIIFGVRMPPQPGPDMLLKGGESLVAGALKLDVINTPGHSKGGICLYERSEGLLFTGDTLFAGSIGRTDFEGGSYGEIMDSIRKKILTLDPATTVLPGHGPASTVGEEKETNPFLTGKGL